MFIKGKSLLLYLLSYCLYPWLCPHIWYNIHQLSLLNLISVVSFMCSFTFTFSTYMTFTFVTCDVYFHIKYPSISISSFYVITIRRKLWVCNVWVYMRPCLHIFIINMFYQLVWHCQRSFECVLHEPFLSNLNIQSQTQNTFILQLQSPSISICHELNTWPTQ